ncbi:uncharacterized protein LOC132048836 [Lycium ferocissimum]|uniref:uncharacterized protein LOC132048836 n=1 Tax=Lycium ferocissimum TaxID=112874 RepID=UPI002814F52D|nr:uncharacterized protein LOC132048836 [Lycium ferocissimum]
MGAVDKYGVEFVTFQFLGDAKLWWRAYVECRPAGSPPLTWVQFYSVFLDKYVPRTLRDRRKDEFSTIGQGNSSVAVYESRFHSLSRYALQLLPTEGERIRRFVKGLNTGLQLSALQLVATGASFQEIVEHVRIVEGIRHESYTRQVEKKARKGGMFSNSFSRGQSSQVYSGRPVQSAMQVSAGGPSGANYQASGQHGGYTASSASVQRPTLDRACFECGEIGHIKRYCPRLRQSGQGTQYQTPRAPFAPDRGGKDRAPAGQGGAATP